VLVVGVRDRWYMKPPILVVGVCGGCGAVGSRLGFWLAQLMCEDARPKIRV
jgi:hypothetical protein